MIQAPLGTAFVGAIGGLMGTEMILGSGKIAGKYKLGTLPMAVFSLMSFWCSLILLEE